MKEERDNEAEILDNCLKLRGQSLEIKKALH